MKENENHKVIKKLEAPLLWSTIRARDLCLFAIPAAIALVATASILCVCVSLTISFFIKKAFKRVPPKYCIRLLYWYLPTKHTNRFFGTQFAPSHVQLWIRR